MEGSTKTMKAILLKEINGKLFVEDVPIPVPKPGQVLVKMEAAPIHPADFTMLRGIYGVKKSLPMIPGLEGSGVVVENGGGLLGWKLKGQKVAVSSGPNTTGTWAEYMIADSAKCIPLNNDISFEEGAFAIGNPLTALGFYDYASRENARAVILSAACSAVARMSARYIQSKGMAVINIIRKKEQEEILKEDGMKYVLNSSDENFETELKKLVTQLNPTVFFDSVAGTLTGRVLKEMPNKSVVYMYGFLSKDKCEIDGRDLRYNQKTVKGFWLNQWIKEKGMVKLLFLLNEMKSHIKTTLKTTISKIISIDEIDEGINFYKKNMSEGKVLMRFSHKKDMVVDEEKKKEKANEEEKNESQKLNIIPETKENKQNLEEEEQKEDFKKEQKTEKNENSPHKTDVLKEENEEK